MNADVLLARVKKDGALPPTANLLDSDIIDKINTQLSSIVGMLVEAEREEFLTDTQDVQLLTTQSAYPFPERAMATSARVLKFVDSSGAEDPKPLRQFALSEVGDFAFITGDPVGFYLTATDINPLPRPGTATTGKLRIYYSRRPSALVQDLTSPDGHTQVFTISNITVAGGNSTVTVNANHAELNNMSFDIQSAKSPYKLLAKDLVATTGSAGIIGTTLVFNGIDLTGIGWAAGDFVTMAKTSYIPLLPQEAHDFLLDFSIAKCLGDINHKERAAKFENDGKGKYSLFLKVTAPRLGQNAKPVSAWKGWRRRSVR